MAKDPIATFLERHAAAWNAHDVAELCAHHAENGVLFSPMFAMVQGRGRICPTYAALFEAFPDWHLRFGASIVEGNRVALPFSVAATHEGDFMGMGGTGRPCEFEGVSLLEFDDDLLIREERRTYDLTGLLTRLGILKVKPARPA